MLGPTEFLPLTPFLEAILWVEAVVYLGLGLFELFDDYFHRPPLWTALNGRPNGYLRLMSKSARKLHAAVCLILGWIALNGLLEHQVSRFEIETLFISLAVVMSFVWSTKLPGVLGIVGIVSKPEFWLQIAMFVGFLQYIRLEVALVCVFVNLWGISFLFLRGKETMFVPYSTETVLRDMEDALGVEGTRRLRRLLGRSRVDGPDDEAPRSTGS